MWGGLKELMHGNLSVLGLAHSRAVINNRGNFSLYGLQNKPVSHLPLTSPVAEFVTPRVSVPSIHIDYQDAKTLTVFVDRGNGAVFSRTEAEENNPVNNVAILIWVYEAISTEAISIQPSYWLRYVKSRNIMRLPHCPIQANSEGMVTEKLWPWWH